MQSTPARFRARYRRMRWLLALVGNVQAALAAVDELIEAERPHLSGRDQCRAPVPAQQEPRTGGRPSARHPSIGLLQSVF